jgi:hypothetical protein
LPWTIKTYFAFFDEGHAFAFEKYHKSPSGRAFGKKVASMALRTGRPLQQLGKPPDF